MKLPTFIILAGALVAISLFSYQTNKASAIGLIPVAGRLTAIAWCNNGVLLTVVGANPGLFLVQFGPRSFEIFPGKGCEAFLDGTTHVCSAYQIYRPGVNSVGGDAIPGGVCNVIGSPAVIPALGTMRLVWTSPI